MTKPIKFNKVVIVGVGLIGGSLGLALRKKKLAGQVIGVARTAETIAKAKRARAITRGTTNLAAAARGADLVILATPVGQIVPLAQQAAQVMKEGGIITDVGSTKADVVTALDRVLPKRCSFVGSHPLAGSEQQGVAAASATLFANSLCIITPTAGTSQHALDLVRQLWKDVGATVVEFRPQVHDKLLSLLSHLPHLLAVALSNSTPSSQLSYAPRSFRDMTRIAMSDPVLWRDILLTNRNEILGALEQFESNLAHLRSLLLRQDAQGLVQVFAQAKTLREQLSE